jgi:hypothetical protein
VTPGSRDRENAFWALIKRSTIALFSAGCPHVPKRGAYSLSRRGMAKPGSELGIAACKLLKIES